MRQEPASSVGGPVVPEIPAQLSRQAKLALRLARCAAQLRCRPRKMMGSPLPDPRGAIRRPPRKQAYIHMELLRLPAASPLAPRRLRDSAQDVAKKIEYASLAFSNFHRVHGVRFAAPAGKGSSRRRQGP